MFRTFSNYLSFFVFAIFISVAVLFFIMKKSSHLVVWNHSTKDAISVYCIFDNKKYSLQNIMNNTAKNLKFSFKSNISTECRVVGYDKSYHIDLKQGKFNDYGVDQEMKFYRINSPD